MPPSIAQRLDQIKDLPPMPNTLQKVLEEMDNIASSAQRLETIIRQDPVLAAKILKVANSPAYGLSGKIQTISHAIVVLGFEEVRNLVIGISLTQAFGQDADLEEFPARDMWLHCIGVATVSMDIAKLSPEFDPEEFFTMGLIHDIGRFLMCAFFANDLREIVKIQHEKQVPLFIAEEEYGFSHAEAGAYIAKKWNLNERMVSAVRYHHHPISAGDEEKSCAIIFLADQLCHKLGIGWSSAWLPEKIKLPKALGISGAEVQKIAKNLRDKKDDLEQGWSKALGD